MKQPENRHHRWMRRALISTVACLVAVSLTGVLYLRLIEIRTETVTFRNGNVTLAGTLALPRWRSGPFPAVVVVQGSGLLPRWVYWSYARHLVPAGMAVLIYDKRGIGESSGTTPTGAVWTIEGVANCGKSFSTLADDTLAAVALLKGRGDIDKARIGLAGISQAGWVMPLAATRGSDVAFIISVSGPAVSCGIEDRYSQLSGEYRAYPEFSAPAPYAEGELTDAEIGQRLDEYAGPAGYDPLPVLESLRIPSLWLLGGRDCSVPTARSVENLKRLIAAGVPVEFRIYPDADHLLTRGGGCKPGIGRLWRRVDYWSDAKDWLGRKGFLRTT